MRKSRGRSLRINAPAFSKNSAGVVKLVTKACFLFCPCHSTVQAHYASTQETTHITFWPVLNNYYNTYSHTGKALRVLVWLQQIVDLLNTHRNIEKRRYNFVLQTFIHSKQESDIILIDKIAIASNLV
jgi:hypothetical protein